MPDHPPARSILLRPPLILVLGLALWGCAQEASDLPAAPACAERLRAEASAALGREAEIEVRAHPGAVALEVRFDDGGRLVYAASERDRTVYTSAATRGLDPDVGRSAESALNAASVKPAFRQAVRACSGPPEAALPEPARRALQAELDRLRTSIRAAAEASGWKTLYIHWLLPALWLALFVCLAARLRRPREPAELGWLLAITALAAVLRLTVGPGGPGDIANTLEGVHDFDGLRDFGFYGRAPEALHLLLSPLLRPSDFTLVGVDLVAGCLSVPAMHGLVRRLGYNRWCARSAALLLAVAPLHVRFSATYNRYVLLVLLTLAGWLWLMAYLEERRPLDLLAATLALSLAPQCRPEALLLPGLTIALVLAWRYGGERDERRLPARSLLVALGLSLGLVLPPIVAVVTTAFDSPGARVAYIDVTRPIFDANHNAWLAASFNPLPWAVLSGVGLLVAPRGNRWLVLWVALSAIVLTAMVASTPLGSGNLTAARYHLAALPLYLVLAAAGLEGLITLLGPRLRQLATVRIVAALVVASAACLTMAHVNRTTTLDQEWQFLQRALPKIPTGCTIVAYEPLLDGGLRAPRSLSRSLGLDHRWVWTPPAERERPQCLAYYRPASCSVDWGPGEESERQERLCTLSRDSRWKPVAEAQLIDEPMGGVRYGGGHGPDVGLYLDVTPR